MTKVPGYLDLIDSMDEVFRLASEQRREIHPAESSESVPTLAREEERPMTDQLRERFNFGGTWERAVIGEDWLGVSGMRALWDDADAMAQVAERREHWTHTPVGQLPLDRLSLFGLDRIERNETYLVWPDAGGEPSIVHFFGHDQKVFEDLEAYLAYWLGCGSSGATGMREVSIT